MRKLNELEVGTKKDLNVLVIGLEERMTKNNRPYVVFQVTDGESVADIRKWDATVAEYECYKDTVVNMDIRTSLYNNNRSYDTDMVLPTHLPASDFVRKVPEDIATMMASIMDRVKKIEMPELRDMLLAILMDYKQPLMYWAAAKSMHHNLYGGLIYHMYRMGKNADLQCDLYPILNRDLLVCGVYLHDIGKLMELDTSIMGSAEYTLTGSLLGHLYLGMNLLEDYALRFKIPEDTKLQLLHMIASHHGKQEYGAIVVPKTIEAEMLHFLDMIDSKMYAVEDALNNMGEDQNSTLVKSMNSTIYRF